MHLAFVSAELTILEAANGFTPLEIYTETFEKYTFQDLLKA